MILVTGSSGLIGRACERFLGKEHDLVGISTEPADGRSSAVCDVRDVEALADVFERYRPRAVLHLAGLKDIRLCEREPELCHSVNVEGTRNIVELCKKHDAFPVFLSSDYVFSGERPYSSEESPTNPTQEYGHSKAVAEPTVLDAGGAVCRSAGVYGWDSPRPTFVEFVAGELRRERTVELFDDLYNSPTYVGNLCEMMARILSQREAGVFHTAGAQRVNRYEFGVAVAAEFGLNRGLLTASAAPETEQLRPRDCSLEVSRTESRLGVRALDIPGGLRQLRADYGV